MRSASLRDVAAAVDGRLIGPSGRLTVSGVSTDSRTTKKNDLFVALRGERLDGHLYLGGARERGARAAVVEAANPGLGRFGRTLNGFPLIEVGDSLEALGKLAAWARERLDIEVVGITGSTGKTCTKDLLVAALGRKFSVASPPGSYNNEVGAPLAVLGAGPGHQVLVSEMGARRAGDIEYLAGIARPRYGIITNIGPCHLSLFGSEDGVAAAKAELASSLPVDGFLFLNSEDRRTPWIAGRTGAEVVRFGLEKGALYRASQIAVDGSGRPSFELSGPGFKVDVRLGIAGRHQVLNACAAAACAHVMGVPPGDIAIALEGASVSGWRLEFVETPGGFTLVNDAYNANPDSMGAALDTLVSAGRGRRTVAVLGGMAELGRESRRFHEETGRAVASSGVDILVTVGRAAAVYAQAANEAGLPRGSAFRCADIAGALDVLEDVLEPGDLVLVKASRVHGLDRLAGLLADEGAPGSRLKAAADV